MSKFTIVDTDILIDVSRNIPEAIIYITDLENQSPLAVSTITQMKLIVGCRNKQELHALEQFLNRFHLLKTTEPISDKAVELLKQYRLSHGLLIADALIAATAISWECPFASKNQRHYRFIDKLNLLAYTA